MEPVSSEGEREREEEEWWWWGDFLAVSTPFFLSMLLHSKPWCIEWMLQVS